MSTAPIYFRDPSCLEHDPRAHIPGHPDTPERIVAIEAALAERDWLGWQRRGGGAASEQELRMIHTERHVRQIEQLAASGGGAIDADTAVGEASFRAARHAAGAACAMVRALLSGESGLAFCGVRPAGHHAEPDRAMGFCLFNSVAIAAELAIRELGARRVFVLDWDVHHGNGTAEAFRSRSDVLFASIHQSGIYPGTGPLADVGTGPGEGYTINLPVPAGSGEPVWLSLVEHIIVPVATAFAPDLVLLSAGFDAHRDDPLAECSLQTGSFAAMACHLRDLASAVGAPVGGILEGGYELQATAESLGVTLAALAGQGDAIPVAPESITRRAAAHLARYWPM